MRLYAVIALSTCLGFAPSARAAVIATASAQGLPGTPVSISISLTPSSGELVSALQFDIIYDSSLLILSSATAGETATAAGKSLRHNAMAPGHERVIVAGLNQNSLGAGSVADVEFTLVLSAPEESVPLTLSNVLFSDAYGQAVAASVESGAIDIGARAYHSADYAPADWTISLSELLRTIQLYNVGAYACSASGEDGYQPGSGDHDCRFHDSDYVPANWRISLSELLRLIQFYNMRGYHVQSGTEDGFAGGHS